MKQLNWHIVFGNTHIIPDGKTVTPTDDIQTLLHCANIWDKDYTTLAEVLADDDTLFLICISNNAIDYLVRSTTWAVGDALVPKMTSNTTPSGVASASSTYSGRAPYYAFDNNDSTVWLTVGGSGANAWLKYHFDEAVVFNAVKFTLLGGTYANTAYKIQGSNDDSTWVDLYSGTFDVDTSTAEGINVVDFNNTNPYEYMRVFFLAANVGNGSYSGCAGMQLYSASITMSESAMQYIGSNDYAVDSLLEDNTWRTALLNSPYFKEVLNAFVPKMTSDTTPSGVASASAEPDSSHMAYLAFNGNKEDAWGVNNSGQGGWVQYDFGRAVCFKVFELFIAYTSDGTPRTKDYHVKGSNDGSTWSDDLVSGTVVRQAAAQNIKEIAETNYDTYRYYRINANTYTNAWTTLVEINFYGREIGGVQSWLKAGGVEGKKYTTVSEVLSDLTTLATLMASSDAIDYLVTAKGWATEICSDSNAMADIGMNNYAANTLLADETWAEAIGNSTYFTSVLNVSVPIMTDNTHPYGECSADSEYGGIYQAWKAFDGTNSSESDSWYHYGDQVGWIQYRFTSSVRVAKFWMRARNYGGSQPLNPKNFSIKGSNDGVTYTTIQSYTDVIMSANEAQSFAMPISADYIYYKMDITASNCPINSQNIAIGQLQFYGRKDI